MALHSSIMAWKILWAQELGRLQSMGPQRVGHDWATEHTHTHSPAVILNSHTVVQFHQVLPASSACSVMSNSLHPHGLSSLQTPLSLEFSRPGILGQVAISYSRGSSGRRDWTCVSCVFCIDKWILYQLCHLGYLIRFWIIHKLNHTVWTPFMPGLLAQYYFCETHSYYCTSL